MFIGIGVILRVVAIRLPAAFRRPRPISSRRGSRSRDSWRSRSNSELGADILGTAVARVGMRSALAAIAVIRTALNYFLSREMSEEFCRRRSAATRRVNRLSDGAISTSTSCGGAA